MEGRRRIDKMSIRKYCTREGNHMYRCTVCSKTYTHISNFCRHFLSAHCGVKQDVHCPVCFKPFTRKDNMMTHAKQVHGVTIMKNHPTTVDQPSPEHQEFNISWSYWAVVLENFLHEMVYKSWAVDIIYKGSYFFSFK